MATVTLESVSLTYTNGHRGLVDIDLRVGDGEFLALIGPSGSGKTTLLRTLAGFHTPSSGVISINGERVSEPGRTLEPERRGLGMVFQQHAVWPHLSVGANVEYPLKRAGVGRRGRRSRVSDTLELVGLGGFEKRNPATLSGGQRQRVALARAIVTRPRVLLLDEALSALDEPLRDRLRLELRMLARELGLTVIHVTHDRAEALSLADRVAVLDQGRLQQVAAPAELLRSPESAFLARFVSDAHVFTGRLAQQRVTLPELGLVFELDQLRFMDGLGRDDTAEVELAVLPEHVALEPDPHGEAVVVSSLFGPGGDDAVVDLQGLQLRSRQPGARFREGDRVNLRVQHALVYASTRTPVDRKAEPVAAK